MNHLWDQIGADATTPIGPLVVVGAGALGSAVCGLLLSLRVERVLVIDPERIEPRNLGTSPLLREAVMALGGAPGRGKAEALVGLAARRGLAWQALAGEIADAGWQALRGCRTLLCSPDSALARVETAFVARSLGLAMIDGGVHGEGRRAGRVARFPAHRASACYLCGIRATRRAELLSFASSPTLSCAGEAEAPAMTGPAAAIDRVAAGMVAAWLALDEAADAFVDRLIGDAEGVWTTERLALPRSASCPWHDLPAPGHLVSLRAGRPVAASLAALDLRDAVLQLPWPICLQARCGACGTMRPGPPRRVAWIRRRAVCAGCGVMGKMEPLATLDAVQPGSEEAGWTPETLGQPEDQLFVVRRVFRGSTP